MSLNSFFSFMALAPESLSYDGHKALLSIHYLTFRGKGLTSETRTVCGN